MKEDKLKQLTIEQRVDILLEVGIDRPKKWMNVHGYKDPEQAVVAGDARAADEWQRLRDHYLQETSFLFDVIAELVTRLSNK